MEETKQKEIQKQGMEKETVAATATAPMENPITEGVIWKQLLIFFFPILFGTFFQQLYNAVDAIIVGQFVGKEALSAVGGATGSVIQLLVGFFVGLSGGATVIISQYYGAKREEMVGYAVHTAIAFCLIGGVILMGLGIVGAPWVLKVMDTPEDVLDAAVLYMRIYFAGVIGNLIYNMGSGILRAVGDSKRPLYFLIVSCLTNIVLDFLFVLGFRMGVAGAALATIISQLLSAGLVIVVLARTKDMYRLTLSKIGIDRRMLGRIIKIGFPSGLQSMLYSLSNVIIQSSVNSLGTDTVAAWTAYSKIDSIFWMIVNAFGISVTTFVGQNYGAGKGERVHKGIRVCLGMTVVTTVVVSFLQYNFGVYLYELFTKDAEVVRIGIDVLHFMVPVYITYVGIEIISGALRGIGDCWIPTLICCLGICGIRVLWICYAVPLHKTIQMIAFSYPLTWVVTTILFVLYYFFFSRLGRKGDI